MPILNNLLIIVLFQPKYIRKHIRRIRNPIDSRPLNFRRRSLAFADTILR
jgi:hypothetical protein